MSVQLTDGTNNNVVDATSKGILVQNPKVVAQAGYVVPQFEIDAGSLSGTPYRKSPNVSEDNRLSVGLDTPMFDYTFNATAQNTSIWKFSAATTTMAATMSSGLLTLNSGSVLTINAACSLSTCRTFPLRGNAAQHFEQIININATPVANQVFEFGYFNSTATGATPVQPTDGCWFQLTSAGLIGVLAFNGTITTTGTLVAAGSIPVATNKEVKIILAEGAVEFWYGGAFANEIAVPAGNTQPFLTTALPLTYQARNSGTVTGTPCLLRLADSHVDQQDLNLNKPYSMQQCAMGLSGYQGQDGGTMGSTAIYTNAALAAAAALTNTTAAAQFTGLGGVALVLPTLTAGTDGILFAYQVPVGTVNQTPRTLIVSGIYMDAAVQTVLVGGPLNLVMGVAYGSTAVSLATTESASFVSPATKAPRRVPLGILNFIAAAAAGTGAVDIIRTFRSPIVVNPGEWFVITCRNVGTVTSTGALAMTATVDCFWQ